MNFRFGELSLGNFGSEKLTWELSLGNFGLGFLPGIFGLGSLAWDLWVGIWGLGNWDPEAGGTAWPYPGEPSRARCGTGSLDAE